MMVVVAVVAEEVAMVVVVPAAAVPVELSLHSRVLTYLHICNTTVIVNNKKTMYECGASQQGYKHAHA
jgi:hypothetical protein